MPGTFSKISEDYGVPLIAKLDPVAAFTIGKLKVDGDVGKADVSTRPDRERLALLLGQEENVMESSS